MSELENLAVAIVVRTITPTVVGDRRNDRIVNFVSGQEDGRQLYGCWNSMGRDFGRNRMNGSLAAEPKTNFKVLCQRSIGSTTVYYSQIKLHEQVVSIGFPIVRCGRTHGKLLTSVTQAVSNVIVAGKIVRITTIQPTNGKLVAPFNRVIRVRVVMLNG